MKHIKSFIRFLCVYRERELWTFHMDFYNIHNLYYYKYCFNTRSYIKYIMEYPENQLLYNEFIEVTSDMYKKYNISKFI